MPKCPKGLLIPFLINTAGNPTSQNRKIEKQIYLSSVPCVSFKLNLGMNLLWVQSIDAKEWKVVVQEIIRFMKADAACEISRPLRYSVLLDPHPLSIPAVDRLEGAKPLRLEDAILASYHHNEVSCLDLIDYVITCFKPVSSNTG